MAIGRRRLPAQRQRRRPPKGGRGGDREGATRSVIAAMTAARRPFFRSKKTCPFSGDNAPKIDYKDVKLLQRFISERGKIVPARITAVSNKKQRDPGEARSSARASLALLPYLVK